MHALTADIIPVALAGSRVLFAGLWNMLRGGSPNLSQTLMRWRVVLQFIAPASSWRRSLPGRTRRATSPFTKA